MLFGFVLYFTEKHNNDDNNSYSKSLSLFFLQKLKFYNVPILFIIKASHHNLFKSISLFHDSNANQGNERL